MLKGIIFDFDGTLFDSMFVWDIAGETYLRSIGRNPEADLHLRLKDMSLQQAAGYIQSQYRLPISVDEIISGINRTVEDFYFHTVMPKAGIVEVLNELQQRNIKMCIATATDHYQVEAALKRCGLRNFFSEIFTCSEVGSGKDRPQLYRAAMEHLHTDRSNTLVIEDAYYAVQTAKKDGFTVIGVYDAHERRHSDVQALSDLYITDYFDLEDFWKFLSDQ